jgi:hypothetical protein
MGHTLLVNATSHVAAEWFQPQERPAAAMVVNLMNFVGACLSFMMPPMLVTPGVSISSPGLSSTAAQLGALLNAQLIVTLLCLFLTVLVYRSGPLARHTEGCCDHESKTAVIPELRHILTLKDFWVVSWQFALYLAVMNTFDAVEGSLLLSYGYSDALAAQTAVSFLMGSLVSTAFESAVIKHPGQYRNSLIGVHIIHALSCVLALVCLMGQFHPTCFVIAVGVMGLTTPGWGCSFEIGSEVCYPAREATVSALLEALGSVVSIAGIVFAQPLIDAGRPNVVLYFMTLACVLSGIMMFGLGGRLSRHEAEEEDTKRSLEMAAMDSCPMLMETLVAVDDKLGIPSHVSHNLQFLTVCSSSSQFCSSLQRACALHRASRPAPEDDHLFSDARRSPGGQIST